MTIKELFEWAQNHNVENCSLALEGMDETGGIFDYAVFPQIAEDNNEQIVTL